MIGLLRTSGGSKYGLCDRWLFHYALWASEMDIRELQIMDDVSMFSMICLWISNHFSSQIPAPETLRVYISLGYAHYLHHPRRRLLPVITAILANLNKLTHWGRVTHISVSKLTITSSDNGLSPGRRQIIIWTNAGILLIWNKLQWNFNRNFI